MILLAPPLEPPDVTIVMGVNDEALSAGAPHRLERLLDRALPRAGAPPDPDDAFGVRRAIFTTIHSYTSAHRLADVPAEDKRRGRAAAENIIPQESRSPAMLLDLIARALRDASPATR